MKTVICLREKIFTDLMTGAGKQVLYFRRDIINNLKLQTAFRREKGRDMPIKMETWE